MNPDENCAPSPWATPASSPIDMHGWSEDYSFPSAPESSSCANRLLKSESQCLASGSIGWFLRLCNLGIQHCSVAPPSLSLSFLSPVEEKKPGPSVDSSVSYP